MCSTERQKMKYDWDSVVVLIYKKSTAVTECSNKVKYKRPDAKRRSNMRLSWLGSADETPLKCHGSVLINTGLRAPS